MKKEEICEKAVVKSSMYHLIWQTNDQPDLMTNWQNEQNFMIPYQSNDQMTKIVS